jgi:hypothetical protein
MSLIDGDDVPMAKRFVSLDAACDKLRVDAATLRQLMADAGVCFCHCVDDEPFLDMWSVVQLGRFQRGPIRSRVF